MNATGEIQGRGDVEVIIWYCLYYSLAVCGALSALGLIFIIPSVRELRTRGLNYLIWTIAWAHLAQAILYTPWFQQRLYGTSLSSCT